MLKMLSVSFFSGKSLEAASLKSQIFHNAQVWKKCMVGFVMFCLVWSVKTILMLV